MNRSKAAEERLEAAGGHTGLSIAQLAAQMDLIITSLPLPVDVAQVYLDLAIEMAKESGVELSVGSRVGSLLRSAIRDGFTSQDFRDYYYKEDFYD